MVVVDFTHILQDFITTTGAIKRLPKFWWRTPKNMGKYVIQENALENVVCEMASILSRPECVNGPLVHIIFWWVSDWISLR